MSLLESEEEEIAEQAIWAIGNIAGDNSTFRDEILKFGVGNLAKIGLKTKNPSVFKNVTWSLSNLSRGKPPAPYAKLKEAGKVFAEAVKSKDEEVVVDALWALSCLSGRGLIGGNFWGYGKFLDGNDEQIQEVVDLGIVPHILKFLKY